MRHRAGTRGTGTGGAAGSKCARRGPWGHVRPGTYFECGLAPEGSHAPARCCGNTRKSRPFQGRLATAQRNYAAGEPREGVRAVSCVASREGRRLQRASGQGTSTTAIGPTVRTAASREPPLDPSGGHGMVCFPMHTLSLVFLFSSLVLTARAADGVQSLFNGRDLDGREKHGGGATYAVEDDAIVGTNGPGQNTFLCTAREFGDFELEFEVRLLAPLNSGVQIRSRARIEQRDGVDTEIVYGPQIEIERSTGE